MTLEAVMLCIDNSEFARNGDYNPSRLDAQTDCANVVAGAKSQQHPENVVGVAFMANAEIKLTPCQDIGKVLSVLSEVPFSGEGGGCDLVRSIQTSSIALKHRQNKNQKQRIICFVASPVLAPEKQLEQLGKLLKKNNVSVDVVLIGDVEGSNKPKLEKFVDCAGTGSHFINVEAGKILSDVVVSSAILLGEGSEGATAGGDEFGFDANMDPELAMAIRLSMEEERQRQAGAAAGTSAASTAGASSERAPLSVTSPPGGDEFDAELRAALLASMGEEAAGTVPATSTGDVDMDEELRKALAESMEDWGGDSKEEPDDPALVAELLATLPGADINDPRIQAALRAVREQKRQQK